MHGCVNECLVLRGCKARSLGDNNKMCLYISSDFIRFLSEFINFSRQRLKNNNKFTSLVNRD